MVKALSVLAFSLGLLVFSNFSHAQVFDDSGVTGDVPVLDPNDVVEKALRAPKEVGLGSASDSFLCEVSSSKSILIAWGEDKNLHFSEMLENSKTGREKIYTHAKIVEQNGNILIYENDDMVAMIQPRLWKWLYGTFLDPLDFAQVVGQKLKCVRL